MGNFRFWGTISVQSAFEVHGLFRRLGEKFYALFMFMTMKHIHTGLDLCVWSELCLAHLKRRKETTRKF